MVHPIVERLYELLTGTPYITTRSMVDEYGPTWATRYPELAERSDWELLARDIRDIVAEIEARRSQSPTEAEQQLIDARKTSRGGRR